MQRSSLPLFMEEYLWEQERDKRQVNKCSPSPVCKINELINKTPPSPPKLVAWQQTDSQKALRQQRIFVSAPWLDKPRAPRGTMGRGTAGISRPVDEAVVNGCRCFRLVHACVEWIRFVASAAYRSSMNKYYSIYLWRIDLFPCSGGALIMWSGRFASLECASLLWRRTVTISRSDFDFGWVISL